MPLSLTVLRCPPTVAPEVRHIGGGEFSIGRGADNDWVLPDPAKHLSKRHCVIAYRHGAWQVAGTSSNGTFLNRAESPLEAGPPHPLADGDRLVLGAYEIEVRIVDEPRASAWQAAPAGAAKPASLDNPFDDDPFASSSYPPVQASSGRPAPISGPFSPTLPADFDPLAPESDDIHPGPAVADHSPAVSDAISLPSARSVLPDDWDLDDLASPAPPVPPPSAPAPPPPAAVRDPVQPVVDARIPSATPPATPAADLLTAFLRGAGMADVVLVDPVQTMQQLGGAFRALVSGIRHVLIARSEVKREFRIEATMIQKRGNNLLKFSANDDDALIGLLGAGRQTGMSPEDAITDALRDIRIHELATMTAMQTAVRALLLRLGPDQIRDAKDQGGGLALLGNRKAKAWDAYEALHAEVLASLSDNFDSVFGKRFAQAYEQAMQELLARRES
jgi:type VI secretion system protein ImpI/type VI secretion system protein